MKKEFFASKEHGYVGNIFYDMYYCTEFGQLCCYLFYGDYFSSVPVDEKVNIFNYGTDVELKYNRLLINDDERTSDVSMSDKYESAFNELYEWSF
jgi:hypothetical protein